MRITYDPHADALYLALRPEGLQSRVIRMSGDVAFDFDERVGVIGIEILGASALFADPDRPGIEFRELSVPPAPAPRRAERSTPGEASG